MASPQSSETGPLTLKDEHYPGFEDELRSRVQWLMVYRLVFTSLLLGSTILVQWGGTSSMVDPALLVLYGVIAGTYVLTFVYALIFRRVRVVPLTYFQLAVDTLEVTIIIYVTGGYFSVFSFLYMVVIIYSSLLLYRKGSMVTASLSSIQYGAMIDLEFFGLLDYFSPAEGIALREVEWSVVLYKVMVTIVACFLVAMLSSLLAEQVRRTRQELRAVREHVRRVEKMALTGEVAARLVHEIKNPLAALVGSVRLLGDELSGHSAQERLVRIILREADRLNGLVSDFFMFTRPAAGSPRPVELSPILEEILELFQKDTACRDRITVVKRMMPGLWVRMDPAHLRQVIWNLLLNAAEAVREKGNIQVQTGPMGEGQVFIRVTDDGMGIPPEFMDRVFDPFFTTKPRGSGLGLSIVHRILDSYGARLDVESTTGRGAAFTIVARRTAPSRNPG